MIVMFGNKTVKQMIEENNMSKEESEWFETFISMAMTIRKHRRLRKVFNESKEKGE